MTPEEELFEVRIPRSKIAQFARIQSDGGLDGDLEYISWSPKHDPHLVSLDGRFTLQQLRAIIEHVTKTMVQRHRTKRTGDE